MVQIGVSGSFWDQGWRLIGDMVQIGVSGSIWMQDYDMVQNRRIRQVLDVGRRLIGNMVQKRRIRQFLDARGRLFGDIVKVGRIVIAYYAIQLIDEYNVVVLR